MKRIVKLLVLLGIIFFIYTMFNKEDARNVAKETVAQLPTSAPTSKIEQGTITIVNTDETSDQPVKGAVFTITAAGSTKVVDTVTTDASGEATSSLLDYGTSYTIKQQKINVPYQLSKEEQQLAVNAPEQQLSFTNRVLEHVKDFETTPDGEIKIKKVYIDVDTVMQKPELPNGCEITSLTAVLNYYGYDVTKTEMADNYLPKQPFSTKNKKLYGPDPYQAYAGDPRELKGGFFSFAPPIVEAANLYFDVVGRSSSTTDISGSSREEMIDKLNKGIPVVTWITLDLTPPKMNYGWYYNDTDVYHSAPVNLHVVVLNGYEDGIVHVMNPLKGQATYDADTFFNSYEEMGSHAMIVGN
ncbi:C39 family peptidase [Paenibacillus sp. FJAT-27812]|uniref:C39 family peptidase n=1 Tax=Paenibacillus sp. FJAT-27812 TaxID=1684143 RepID=UPI0006A7BB25|nr:C39 family peptidase [Paenibacillus sp. FJAT-27812]